MRNVTIYAHVLIFFTGPSQSHVDKMQPEQNQSEGGLGSDLRGLHDIREVLSPPHCGWVLGGIPQCDGSVFIHQ